MTGKPPRTMKVKWSPEIAEDLEAFHTVEAEQQLTRAMREDPTTDMAARLESIAEDIAEGTWCSRWDAERGQHGWWTIQAEFFVMPAADWTLPWAGESLGRRRYLLRRRVEDAFANSVVGVLGNVEFPTLMETTGWEQQFPIKVTFSVPHPGQPEEKYVKGQIEKLPAGYTFEWPWSQAKSGNHDVICVCCGDRAHAHRQISEYPHRFMPYGWVIEAGSRAAICRTCYQSGARHGRWQPTFFANHEAMVQTTKDGDPIVEIVPRKQRVLIPDEVEELAEAMEKLEVAHKEMERMDDYKEAAPMSTREKAKEQVKHVGSALALGTKLALVDEGGDVLLDIAKELGKDVPMINAMLTSPEGRELAKVIVAFGLHGLCTYSEIVPKKDAVRAVCELQMTASSFTLIRPRLKVMRKYFEALAGIGEQVVGEETSTNGVRARVSEGEDDVEAEEEVETEKVVKKKVAKAKRKA